MTTLQRIYEEIRSDPANRQAPFADCLPVYAASEKAKIIIVGQAPGRRAQLSGIPWNDASGIKLRSWLGVTDAQFYNPDLIALVPMDFYYPGKGAHGDLPPRKEFAPKWHPRIFAQMPDVQLVVLIGSYAQRYYLGTIAKATLTETVQSFHEYLPRYLPLVHPSPLNIRWLTINPWFVSDVVPELRIRVHSILS